LYATIPPRCLLFPPCRLAARPPLKKNVVRRRWRVFLRLSVGGAWAPRSLFACPPPPLVGSLRAAPRWGSACVRLHMVSGRARKRYERSHLLALPPVLVHTIIPPHARATRPVCAARDLCGIARTPIPLKKRKKKENPKDYKKYTSLTRLYILYNNVVIIQYIQGLP